RVKTLTDPSHRFKVSKNAEQLNNGHVPAFSMVYVEGASKFIQNCKRLMPLAPRLRVRAVGRMWCLMVWPSMMLLVVLESWVRVISCGS
ncbi:hypothetical protein P692DRAFT_201728082, partial [Suillus brevipes Sb2]